MYVYEIICIHVMKCIVLAYTITKMQTKQPMTEQTISIAQYEGKVQITKEKVCTDQLSFLVLGQVPEDSVLRELIIPSGRWGSNIFVMVYSSII